MRNSPPKQVTQSAPVRSKIERSFDDNVYKYHHSNEDNVQWFDRIIEKILRLMFHPFCLDRSIVDKLNSYSLHHNYGLNLREKNPIILR